MLAMEEDELKKIAPFVLTAIETHFLSTIKEYGSRVSNMTLADNNEILLWLINSLINKIAPEGEQVQITQADLEKIIKRDKERRFVVKDMKKYEDANSLKFSDRALGKNGKPPKVQEGAKMIMTRDVSEEFHRKVAKQEYDIIGKIVKSAYIIKKIQMQKQFAQMDGDNEDFPVLMIFDKLLEIINSAFNKRGQLIQLNEQDLKGAIAKLGDFQVMTVKEYRMIITESDFVPESLAMEPIRGSTLVVVQKSDLFQRKRDRSAAS